MLKKNENALSHEDLLKKKNKELEVLNDELSRFAYSLTHDLKAPVRHATSFLGLLKTELPEQSLSSDAKSYMSSIEQALSNMREMIEGMLEISRVNAHGVHKEKLILKDVLEDVLIQFKDEDFSVRHDYNSEEFLLADRLMIFQLFQNLIQNSIKFKSKLRPLCLVFSVKRLSDSKVYSVKDNSLGFNTSDNIFVAFKRSLNHSVKGTGIGLSICKKIVERHGGKIWAESTLHEGAEFFFTLGAS